MLLLVYFYSFCCTCRAQRLTILQNTRKTSYGLHGLHLITLFIYKYFLDAAFTFVNIRRISSQEVCVYIYWNLFITSAPLRQVKVSKTCRPRSEIVLYTKATFGTPESVLTIEVSE